MMVAQALNFWNGENGSSALWIKVIVAFLLGLVAIAALTKGPPTMRRPLVACVTVLAARIYIGYWLWPEPVAREAGTLPNGFLQNLGFYFDGAQTTVCTFYNILAAFLLGLGVYSILRIHVRKLAKQQQDWFFSAVLLFSMFMMIGFGYADWLNHLDPVKAPIWDDVTKYPWNNKVYDIMFEGLLQQMDAAMFSIIAFYILSAAYRAFRIRSVEATILLGTALIVMLSLMGAVAYLWDVKVIGDPGGFTENFKLY